MITNQSALIIIHLKQPLQKRRGLEKGSYLIHSTKAMSLIGRVRPLIKSRRRHLILHRTNKKMLLRFNSMSKTSKIKREKCNRTQTPTLKKFNTAMVNFKKSQFHQPKVHIKYQLNDTVQLHSQKNQTIQSTNKMNSSPMKQTANSMFLNPNRKTN